MDVRGEVGLVVRRVVAGRVRGVMVVDEGVTKQEEQYCLGTSDRTDGRSCHHLREGVHLQFSRECIDGQKHHDYEYKRRVQSSLLIRPTQTALGGGEPASLAAFLLPFLPGISRT